MPTVQFAWGPRKYFIPNNCCEHAMMVTEYSSIKYILLTTEVSEAMYGNQPIFMESFLTF